MAPSPLPSTTTTAAAGSRGVPRSILAILALSLVLMLSFRQLSINCDLTGYLSSVDVFRSDLPSVDVVENSQGPPAAAAAADGGGTQLARRKDSSEGDRGSALSSPDPDAEVAAADVNRTETPLPSSNDPIPVQLMKQYKAWHSVDALQREDPGTLNQRGYAIANLRCIRSSGNMLHVFLNHIFWAILTNRTALLYYGEEKEACDQVLLVESWFPRYDDWAPRLGLDSSFDELKAQGLFHHYKGYWGVQGPGYYKNSSAIPALSGGHIIKLADFGVSFLATNLKQQGGKLMTMLPDDGGGYAGWAATNLHLLGRFYAFGMIFHHCVDFSPFVKESVGYVHFDKPHQVLPATKGVIVHSRHDNISDLGCNVSGEIECLNELISMHPGAKLQVYMMSDRECTISQLKELVPKQPLLGGCSAQTFDGKEAANAELAHEHGRFYGAGFYQDWAYTVSRARDALIPTFAGQRMGFYWRSSSALLYNSMVYNLKTAAWAEGVRDLTKLREIYPWVCGDFKGRHP